MYTKYIFGWNMFYKYLQAFKKRSKTQTVVQLKSRIVILTLHIVRIVGFERENVSIFISN